MSLGTSNRDGGKTSESGHLRALAKVVNGDVLEGLAVSQRAAGANMSVDVAVGDAFVRRSDGSYAHPVFNDAVYNQVITAADGSNPRRDIVVLYVDYNQARSIDVSNNTNGVVKIKVVDGTPAGSPADPNAAAIQASVGSGNPYSILARVRVPAGQTSISNSLIDDLRTMITSKAGTINTAALIDAAVTAAKLADAIITNAKLSTTAGELGGAWQAWTPTITNSGGAITATVNFAKYTRVGKTIHFKIGLTVNSATPGLLSFTTPVAAAQLGEFAGAGREDGVTGKISEVLFKSSTSICAVFFGDAAGSTATAGYFHTIKGSYEAAV